VFPSESAAKFAADLRLGSTAHDSPTGHDSNHGHDCATVMA